MRRLDSGVARLGVRKLDQAHLQQQLALAIEQLAHGGVEGLQTLIGGAQGDRPRRGLGHRLLRIEDALGQGDRLGQFSRGQPRQVDRLQLLALKLLAVFPGVGGHQRPVRIERHIERIRRHSQDARRRLEADIIHIQAGLGAADAIIHGDVDSVGLEDLPDYLALVGAQVKAVHAGRGFQLHCFAGPLRTLLVDGP